MSVNVKQSKLDEKINTPPQGNTGTLVPPNPATTPNTLVPPTGGVTEDLGKAATEAATPLPETPETLEQLKAQLKEYQDKEKILAEQGMTEHQKEIKALQDQLKEMAMKPLLDSKYFKEADLKKYSHRELKAMNDVLSKINGSGQPGAPPRAPESKKPKPVLGRQWDDRLEKWVE